jgi:response regulator RpfG family c-di-GMP phosphodiesterase
VKWIKGQHLNYTFSMQNNLCVYLIDDDTINNFLAKKKIELFDPKINVELFSDAEIAFKKMLNLHDKNEKLPDYIFIDINMPEWDAWDFLNALKESPISLKNQKIYLLSAFINKKEKEQVMKYDIITGTLQKPITVQQISTFFNNNLNL